MKIIVNIDYEMLQAPAYNERWVSLLSEITDQYAGPPDDKVFKDIMLYMCQAIHRANEEHKFWTPTPNQFSWIKQTIAKSKITKLTKTPDELEADRKRWVGDCIGKFLNELNNNAMNSKK